ncbi:TonB family protein [Pseudoalteromonas sp. MMG006]|uniref:energy transducer TonB n=1 Tax=unclassified Pseudoalteromonas TaxID=194690 RepID=UPI001B394AF9|nr:MULTISPECIES: energy transducer TonB [unclassified Pseudoalteromonas]MBQ4800282.1 TonB family protein [Pseudoalteromonas sp. MMG006]MBQ4858758.1 TonB family protein [Pseudoalteromonas sp. MMG007]
MKPQQLALFVGLSLSALSATTLSIQALASQASDPQLVFSQAYQSYLAAVKANKNVQQAAEFAYTSGKAVYGESSDNTANLAINYAKAIKGYGNELNEQRYTLYSKAHTILATNHGKQSIETVDALLGQANYTTSAYQADNYLEQIIEIAETQNNPKFVADMKLEAATLLAKKHSHKKYREAKNYLEEADEYYQENLPENSLERIKADFLMASFAEGRKKYNQAIERLNRIVNVFDSNLNFDHSAELSAHSKLIGLYEKQGKSEEATKHCLAIAKMVPWKESQEQTPLYRVNPKYPVNKVRFSTDGSVVMEFEVNAAGFVKNPKVLSSEGGSAFEKSAKAALEQWRYAPKFENGKPVSAVTQVQLDFKINR